MTAMAVMTSALSVGHRREINLKAPHSNGGNPDAGAQSFDDRPTLRCMRPQPPAILQMKAGDADIRQARQRDNATHSFASPDMQGGV
jgi:hypothetical protein